MERLVGIQPTVSSPGFRARHIIRDNHSHSKAERLSILSPMESRAHFVKLSVQRMERMCRSLAEQVCVSSI